MVNKINWQDYPAATTYLSTELNSLANAGKKLGAEINNTANGDMYADFELYLATQGSARAAGAYVSLYILPSVDGTNFCYGDDSTVPPIHTQIGSFALDAATTARYVTLTHILLPAGRFKILLENSTGIALAATGNTLKYTPYNMEIQ